MVNDLIKIECDELGNTKELKEQIYRDDLDKDMNLYKYEGSDRSYQLNWENYIGDKKLSNGIFFNDIRYLSLVILKLKNTVHYKIFKKELPDNFFELIESRKKFRSEENFTEADKIKDLLNKYGVIFRDNRINSTYRIKRSFYGR